MKAPQQHVSAHKANGDAETASGAQSSPSTKAWAYPLAREGSRCLDVRVAWRDAELFHVSRRAQKWLCALSLCWWRSMSAQKAALKVGLLRLKKHQRQTGLKSNLLAWWATVLLAESSFRRSNQISAKDSDGENFCVDDSNIPAETNADLIKRADPLDRIRVLSAHESEGYSIYEAAVERARTLCRLATGSIKGAINVSRDESSNHNSVHPDRMSSRSMDAKNLSNVLTELSNRYEQDEGTQKLVELALTLWTARKIEEQEPNDKRLNNLRSMQISCREFLEEQEEVLSNLLHNPQTHAKSPARCMGLERFQPRMSPLPTSAQQGKLDGIMVAQGCEKEEHTIHSETNRRNLEDLRREVAAANAVAAIAATECAHLVDICRSGHEELVAVCRELSAASAGHDQRLEGRKDCLETGRECGLEQELARVRPQNKDTWPDTGNKDQNGTDCTHVCVDDSEQIWKKLKGTARDISALAVLMSSNNPRAEAAFLHDCLTRAQTRRAGAETDENGTGGNACEHQKSSCTSVFDAAQAGMASPVDLRSAIRELAAMMLLRNRFVQVEREAAVCAAEKERLAALEQLDESKRELADCYQQLEHLALRSRRALAEETKKCNQVVEEMQTVLADKEHLEKERQQLRALCVLNSEKEREREKEAAEFLAQVSERQRAETKCLQEREDEDRRRVAAEREAAGERQACETERDMLRLSVKSLQERCRRLELQVSQHCPVDVNVTGDSMRRLDNAAARAVGRSDFSSSLELRIQSNEGGSGGSGEMKQRNLLALPSSGGVSRDVPSLVPSAKERSAEGGNTYHCQVKCVTNRVSVTSACSDDQCLLSPPPRCIHSSSINTLDMINHSFHPFLSSVAYEHRNDNATSIPSTSDPGSAQVFDADAPMTRAMSSRRPRCASDPHTPVSPTSTGVGGAKRNVDDSSDDEQGPSPEAQRDTLRLSIKCLHRPPAARASKSASFPCAMSPRTDGPPGPRQLTASPPPEELSNALDEACRELEALEAQLLAL